MTATLGVLGFLAVLSAWFKDAAVAALAIAFITAAIHFRTELRLIIGNATQMPVARLLGVLALFSLVSMAWAPSFAIVPWLQNFWALVMVIGVTAVLPMMSESDIDRFLKTAAFVLGGLAAILCIERLSGGALIGLARPDDPVTIRWTAMTGGLVLSALLAFPITAWVAQRVGPAIAAIGFTALFALTLAFRMDAVPVALAAGLIAGGLVMILGRAGFWLIAAGCIVVLGAWPIAAVAAETFGLSAWVTETIHPNWGYRIAIWSTASQMILDAPIIGHGFHAAKVLGQSADLAPAADGNRTFLHPHNGAIQILLEFGVTGFLLMIGVLIALFQTISVKARDRLTRAAATGSLVTGLSIWMLSFGVWQSWWIATLGLTAIVCALLFRARA